MDNSDSFLKNLYTMLMSQGLGLPGGSIGFPLQTGANLQLNNSQYVREMMNNLQRYQSMPSSNLQNTCPPDISQNMKDQNNDIHKTVPIKDENNPTGDEDENRKDQAERRRELDINNITSVEVRRSKEDSINKRKPISHKDKKNSSQITDKESSQCEESVERPKYFKCSFKDCEKIFPKESNLNDHIRTHTGDKPYKCSNKDCGKSFSQLGNLKKHETVHLGEKPFYCEYPGCGKGFSAMYNLKIHARCHSGEKPYKCRIAGCERDFYDKGNLKYHEKTSHSYEIKTMPFSCEHVGCNLKFKTKKEKLEHHYEHEQACKSEKEAILTLLSNYKSFIVTLCDNYGVDKYSLEEDPMFIELKNKYEDLGKKLVNPDCLNTEENFFDFNL